MDFTIRLTEEQFDVLSSLSKLLKQTETDVLSSYITLVLVQAEPIHHMVKVLEASHEILPSFIRAVTISKSTDLNFGLIIETLLGEMFSNGQIFKDLGSVREYFADPESSQQTEESEQQPKESNDSSLPLGPVDIDLLINGLLKKENKDENNQS